MAEEEREESSVCTSSRKGKGGRVGLPGCMRKRGEGERRWRVRDDLDVRRKNWLSREERKTEETRAVEDIGMERAGKNVIFLLKKGRTDELGGKIGR